MTPIWDVASEFAALDRVYGPSNPINGGVHFDELPQGWLSAEAAC